MRHRGFLFRPLTGAVTRGRRDRAGEIKECLPVLVKGFSMPIRTGVPALLLAAVLAAVAGCNIFDSASDDEPDPVERAERALRDGDYARARNLLTDGNGALRDSTDSLTRYTYAKVLAQENGLAVEELVPLIQAGSGTGGTGNLALLEALDRLDFTTQTQWYRASVEIARLLDPIWNGRTTGPLAPDDIAFDYTVSSILAGVFSLRDTNGDLRIDAQDIRIILSDIGSTPGRDGFGITGGRRMDAAGNVIASYDGLTAFLGVPMTPSKIARSGQTAPVYSPDMINPLLAGFLEFLAGGDESVTLLADRLADYTAYDPGEIREYILRAAGLVNYYWYDDNADNDGDSRIDEETLDGADNDGDGLVDEDSDYISRYDFSDTVNTRYLPLWESWRDRVQGAAE